MHARIQLALVTFGVFIGGIGASIVTTWPMVGTALIAVGTALVGGEVVFAFWELSQKGRVTRRLTVGVGGFAVFILGVFAGYLLDRWGLVPELRRQAEKTIEQRYKQYIEAAGKRADKQDRDVTSLHGTLETVERFAGELKFYVKWDAYADENTGLSFGRCGQLPCPTLQLRPIEGTGPNSIIPIAIDTPGLGTLLAKLPLRKGCWRDLVYAKGYALSVAIESDSFRQPQLGVVFARRIGERPVPPGTYPSHAPDWTDRLVFVEPPGRITCGSEVLVCREGNETKDAVACFSR